MKNIRLDQYMATEVPVHKATQLLSFLAKQLAVQQPDDSQSTFQYDAQRHALIGKTLTINHQPWRAMINLYDFNLHLNSQERLLLFTLANQTLNEVIDSINKQIPNLNLPSWSIHYDLPSTYQLDTFQLKQPTTKTLEEWGQVRHFADTIFEQVNTFIQPPSPVNIWPHHFDTGTYHVLSKDEKGDTASVGTGLAMKDSHVPEPYFYIYGWHRDKTLTYENLTSLPIGKWITGNWNGAAVTLTELIQSDNAKDQLIEFYKAAFGFYKNMLA